MHNLRAATAQIRVVLRALQSTLKAAATRHSMYWAQQFLAQN